MSGNNITGIYFYHPGNGHSGSLDFRVLSGYATSFKQVAVVWDSTKSPVWDKKFLESEIQKLKLNRLIIAGYETGMIKSFFAKIFSRLKIPTDHIYLVDFQEQDVLQQSCMELAKAMLVSAIYNAPFENITSCEDLGVCTETLVIGAGIAGIQASLEIANANQKVHLVEKTGTIGGHMAMFDKTFPTLDCAACILTPKMVEVGQHPNIQLHTCSEIKSVNGDPGNFKVRILKKARRVDVSMCIGCGSCAEKCPSKVASEFDSGTTLRKAIYIPFPQAVPNKYLIDAEACRYAQGKKCGVCVKNCPVPGCINLDERETEIEINVGNIIIATGFKPYDATKLEQYGYGKFPNVLTSVEFERLINAAGPTEGKIVFRTKDKKGNWIFLPESESPDSIAILHCAGSRDENHKKYCSKVCCMYSLKLAHLVKEKLPEAEVYEYFIDMRSFGKGYEEFYERIRNEGVHLYRGKPADIKENGKQLVLRSEDIEAGILREQKVDMVLLSVGMEPADGSGKIAKSCGITVDKDGWFNEANYVTSPVNTHAEGVLIAGTCQGPKDIPDTVAQASAAASEVLQHVVKGRIRKNRNYISLHEIEESAKNYHKLLEAKK